MIKHFDVTLINVDPDATVIQLTYRAQNVSREKAIEITSKVFEPMGFKLYYVIAGYRTDD